VTESVKRVTRRALAPAQIVGSVGVIGCDVSIDNGPTGSVEDASELVGSWSPITDALAPC
jgi:hypothetical protein